MLGGYQARTSPLGLVVLELPDPDVTLLGLRFTPSLSGLLVPEAEYRGGFVDFAKAVVKSFGITPDNGTLEIELDNSNRRFEPEPEPVEPLHVTKAAEAHYAPQPEWWRNAYLSVTGLRFRCCGNLFEDGEHSPWCPAP